MKLYALAMVACLSAGCEGATWARAVVPAPRMAKPPGATWMQYCTFHGADDLGDINRFLQQQGEEGWELVTVAGSTGTIYCFKSLL